MKNSYKILIIIFLLLILTLGAIYYISNAESIHDENSDSNVTAELNILVSFYPLYEFTSNIAKDKAHVSTIIPFGVESHHFELTPSKLLQMQNADIIIKMGFESWDDNEIKELNSDIVIINIIDVLQKQKPELLISAFDDDHDVGHNIDVDPHVWLDPIIVKSISIIIRDSIINLDETNIKYYKENTELYLNNLDKLDNEIKSTLNECESDKFITFHEAFGYFAKQYDLQHVSLSGFAPDSEISGNKIKTIIDFMNDNNIKVIYSEELVDSKFTETISSEVSAKILLLSPIERLTEEEIDQQVTYFDKMMQNLNNIEIGLECKL